MSQKPEELVEVDYGSIELRVLATMDEMKRQGAAFADPHAALAQVIYGTPTARAKAKIINQQDLYGRRR